MNTENLNPAVEKTLLLLQHLGQSERELTQSELARALGIAPSTCYRILQTLLKHYWVRKDADSCYDLSDGVLGPTLKLHRRLVGWQHCRPLLDELAAEAGLSAKLSIRQGDRQVAILRAESPQAIGISSKVDTRFPLIEGSVGTALLSRSEDDEIRKLVNDCTEDILERGNPDLVLARIETVRHKGYYLNTNHTRRRIGAMSAPLIGADGQVAAALTLLGLDEDFAGEQAGVLAGCLLRTARQCETESTYWGRRP